MKTKENFFVCGTEIHTKEGPRLHMTLLRLGNCSENVLDNIKRDIKNELKLKKFQVKFGKVAYLGKNNDVETIKCQIVDSKISGILKELYKKYDIKEYKQNFHVTTKGQKDQLMKMGGFVSDNFFIKQVGVKKYIYTTNFE